MRTKRNKVWILATILVFALPLYVLSYGPYVLFGELGDWDSRVCSVATRGFRPSHAAARRWPQVRKSLTIYRNQWASLASRLATPPPARSFPGLPPTSITEVPDFSKPIPQKPRASKPKLFERDGQKLL
ncbi:MAG: hypothetical protein CMJ78_10635 [Planctomycetaceae bacterium]|nr:hypothetical protein [Planctomycetaceae bacterium]